MPTWWKKLRRGRRGPETARTVSAKARLVVEALEQRLTPTTADPAHDLWRQLPCHASTLTADCPDETPAGQLADAPQGASSYTSLIGLDAIRATTPYKGTGYTVAVLDTGIDYKHAALGGGWGKRVVAGHDFINNDADPMDDNGHGTHIAGIIGSSSATYPGVAPDVKFVALKVLDKYNNGNWTAVEQALQWVITNQAKYNIVAVNLSLGTGNYTSNPYTFLEDEFTKLKGQGVFTAVAAGNRFYTYNSQPGLGYPSISSNVVSVGAVWAGDFGKATFSTGATDYSTAADRVVSMSQRSTALGLMAPGAWITSTAPGGTFRAMAGTSMATAVVSGAATVLHQALDANGRPDLANQTYLLGLMRSTGKTVVDGDDENDNVKNTGLSFKRLDLRAALAAVPQPPTLAPVANQTLSSGSATVTLQGSDPNNDPLTYAARIVDDKALAYQLDQQLGLYYLGSYYLNVRGANEKWVGGSNSTWYGIFPNGELRRWAGSLAETLKPANLLGTFSTAYYTDPSLLWNAAYAQYPPLKLTVVGNQLTIQTTAAWSGSAVVEASVSDGSLSARQRFTVSASSNSPPTLAPLSNRTMPHSQDKLALALSTTDPDGDAITYSAKVLPIDQQTPPVAVAVSGNTLTLDPAVSFVGTFSVAVTASDGKASDTKSFNVTVTNGAPTLSAIANQTMAKGQTSLTLTLAASDPDGDKLTFSARALPPSAQAYQLDQQLGLAQHNGSYYQNLWGKNEKWLTGANGAWYCLMTDGRLYRWAGTFTETMSTTNLVAKFDPIFYTEPRLLWDAQPATVPPLTLSVQGNQLTIQRPTSLLGVYFVEVTVSDGAATAKRTFMLTLN